MDGKPTVTFDGRSLALGWRSVWEATVRDPRSPRFRCLQVELLDEGAWLVAANGALLLRSWVPSLGYLGPTPGIDVAPLVALTVRDGHCRGLGLMRHVSRLTRDEDAPEVLVDVSVGEAPGSLPGLAAPQLALSLEGLELAMLEVLDGQPLDWRALLTEPAADAARPVACLSARALTQLARCAAVQDVPVELRVCDSAKAEVLLRGASPAVDGKVALMHVVEGM